MKLRMQQRKGNSSPNNKKKHKNQAASDLDVDALEGLLCHTIPSLTGDTGGTEFEGLASRSHHTNLVNELDEDRKGGGGEGSKMKRRGSVELDRASEQLVDVVSGKSSNCLPASTISEIHYFIARINDINGSYSDATRSYVNALWIARHGRPASGTEKTSKDLLPREEHVATSVRRLRQCSKRAVKLQGACRLK